MTIKTIQKALTTRVKITKADLVRDESKAAAYLEQKDLLTLRNKLVLSLFLLLAVLLSWLLYYIDFLSKDGFSTIVAAIIGGFVGSAINNIVSSK